MRLNNGILLAILSSFTFSLMGVLVKYVSKEMPSHEVAFFRGLIGTVIIFIIMRYQGIPFSKDGKPLLFLRGVLGGLYMITYFFAISNMKLGDVSILANTSGVFVIIFSSFFLKEKLPKDAWIYVALILIGALLIINPLSYSDYSFYAIFGLLSAVLAAAASITIRKLAKSKKHHNYEIVFYFLFSATVVSFFFMYDQFIVPNLKQMFLLTILAVVSLGAQILLTGAFANANAVIVAIVRYIGILFNTGWGYILFGENLSILSIIGGCIIIFSSIVLSRKKNIGESKS